MNDALALTIISRGVKAGRQRPQVKDMLWKIEEPGQKILSTFKVAYEL